MSFALVVKKELLAIKYSKEAANALISGIISTTKLLRNYNNKSFKITLNNNELILLFKILLNDVEIKYSIIKNTVFLNDFNYKSDLKTIKFLSYYFGGVFLGSGSISKLDATSYHLEMQFYDKQIAETIVDFLNKRSFNFQIILRRKMWVIYLKKSHQIGDFLKTIQTHESLMIFEDQRILRDFKNHLNRYSNLDSYNMKKIVNSNLEFQTLYKKLKSSKLLSLFHKKELDFFKLKLAKPYISLQELVSLYNKKYHLQVTKSALNHYLIKLKKIVLKNT